MIISEPQGAGRHGIHRIRYGAAFSVMVGAPLLVHLILGSRPLSVAATLIAAAGTVIMIGFGLRRHRPSHPLPWYLLAGAALPFATGTVLRELTGYASTPLDEICTLAGYLGSGLAALMWLRPRQARAHPDVILDSGLIGLGALLASWIFLIAPVLHSETPDVNTVTAVALPVCDALLLTLLAHSLATSSRSETSLRLLHTALAGVLATDLGYRLVAAGTLDTAAEVLVLPLIGAYLAAGAAALHPTMVTLGAPRTIRIHHSRQRASVIAVALVLSSLVPVARAPLSPLDQIIVSSVLALLLIGLLIRSERAIGHSARSERRAQYQADHDPLTGLLNRSALLRVLHREHRDWAERALCLLFIDLDEFKAINDSYGHTVGDELIAEAATRIRSTVRRDDVVARYGGDEFVVLAPLERMEATKMAERLLGVFMKPFQLSTGEVPLTASIGLACGGPRDIDASIYDLIRDADAAMYQAKRRGFGYMFHDSIRYTPAEPSRHGWRPRETAV
ncbi:GGDEF domain-containing protein [Nocardia zapadnayensis]|uniref:diguanylate cyclase domain-containing protein n=1 Tax=Nocardia rhamnosiphila TaxID=426716 RepID=UPI002246C5EF|nr:GGDEF domain-containing protein [Nocardia zapadnayensis]MCX0271507.1 GGDEF domain-containing protein [Nocardia zapadnayensis]